MPETRAREPRGVDAGYIGCMDRARLLIVLLSLSVGACSATLEPAGRPPSITGTREEIVARYSFAINRVCDTGVTPELVALYRQVDKIWDGQPTGGGRGSNFGGAREPQLAWHACFQSPGWQ